MLTRLYRFLFNREKKYTEIKDIYNGEHSRIVLVSYDKEDNYRVIKKIYNCKYYDTEVKTNKIFENKPGFMNILAENWDKQEIIYPYYDKGDYYSLMENNTIRKETDFKLIFNIMVNSIKICHDLNIVHGDIKAENFLIGENNHPILIDFALSEKLNVSSKNELVINKNIRGTRLYLSPEAYNGYIGMPVDIWALGVLLYVSINRHFPFDLPDNIKKIDDSCFKLQYPVKSSHFEVSDECVNLINKMLCISASERITIDEICHHPWLN